MLYKKLAIAGVLAAAGASALSAEAGARFLPPAIPPGLKAILPPLEVPAGAARPPAPRAPDSVKPPPAPEPPALPKKVVIPSCDFSGFPAELLLRPGPGKHVVSFKGQDGCLTGVSADALWLDVDVRQAAKEIVITVEENTLEAPRAARLFLLTGGRSVDLALTQAPRLQAQPVPLLQPGVLSWELPLFLPASLALEWEQRVPLASDSAVTWEQLLPSPALEVTWDSPASLPPAGYDEL